MSLYCAVQWEKHIEKFKKNFSVIHPERLDESQPSHSNSIIS